MKSNSSYHLSHFLSLLPCFLASLLLFSLTGCSKNNLSTNNNENSYKIAVAAPQFGPYKELGLSIINGAELAVDLKNKQGGINGKKIELIEVDDGGLAGEGTLKAKNLVDQMILGVIGHLHSDISIPASEIYSKAMIAEITPGSTNPFFTERERVRGYVFRTVGRDDQQGDIAAQFILKKGFKKIAVLYNNRGYGFSLSSEFVKKLSRISKTAEVVFYEMYKVDQKNFLKEIAEIKTKSPEVVFFAGEYGDAASFLKQLRDSGLKIAFLGGEAVFDSEFIKGAKSASEGATIISLSEVKDKDFIEAYSKKFDKELGAYSANSFDATNILIKAIERSSKKEPEKIASEIAMISEYNGLTGKISFDPKGDLTVPNFSIYEVKNGMFTPVQQ